MNCPELEKEVTSEVCTKMKKNEWCNQECLELSALTGDSENPDTAPDIIPGNDTPPETQNEDQGLRQKKRKSDNYRGLCLIKGVIISIGACRSNRRYIRMHPREKSRSQCTGCDWRKNFVKDGQPSKIKKEEKVIPIGKVTSLIPTVPDNLILTICFDKYSHIWETLKNKAEEEIRTLQEQILYELKRSFSQEKGGEKK